MRTLIFLFFLLTSNVYAQDCDTSRTIKTVRGTSMEGIFVENEKIIVFSGYFQCLDPQRNDIAIVKWIGNPAPLVKRIVALPGDVVELRMKGSGNLLYINSELATTTLGEPYHFNKKKSRMMQIYINSYGSKVPAETYIVLGNLPEGTKDSSHMGWVGREMLVGKVRYPN